MNCSVSGITKSFFGYPALQDVNLTLEPGSIYGFVGENGAGKTTLLKIMSGIYRPDAGTVALGGEAVYENPAVKSRIAYVPTQCTLPSTFKRRDLIRMFSSLYPAFDEAKYIRALRGMSIGQKSIRQMSTGMQLMVSLALALAVKPDLLLLDEPFAGLDVIVRHDLIDLLIEEIAERELIMMISSHNVDELERLCDRVIFITKGWITQAGELSDVKRASIKRFQVAFQFDAPEDFISWPGIMDVEQLGRVFTITLDAEHPETIQKIRDSGVLLFEELGITLGEAFRLNYLKGRKNA